MDSQTRPKKSRSVASEPKTPRASKTQRPELGERVQSAPSIAREPHAKRLSDPRRSRNEVKSKRIDDYQQVNLVVLGAPGVGKSTFIQNALELRKPATAPISSSKVSKDGVVFRFGLLELSFNDVDFSNGRRVSFPKYVNNSPVPPVDGVLCLYDVTDQESIAVVPELIGALSKSALPCVLISCKCDGPWEVDPGFNVQLKNSFNCVEIGEVSSLVPGSQKRCMLSILNLILAKSRESSRTQPSQIRRPRAATTLNAPNPGPKDSTDKPRSHSRSKSELPRSRSREPLSVPLDEVFRCGEHSLDKSSDEDDARKPPPEPLYIDTKAPRKHVSRPSEPETPLSSGELFFNDLISPSDDFGSETPQTPDSLYMTSVLRPGTANTSDSQAHRTFLNMEDESQDESTNVELEFSTSQMEKLKLNEHSKQETGVSFEELVNRLLLLPASKQEKKIVPIFLCLYRAFATPVQLLAALIERFDRVDKSQNVPLTKTAEQLRYLQVLAHWTATYPGDFGTHQVRNTVLSFLDRIGQRRVFAGAAKEISSNADIVIGDDDAEWAYGARDSSAAHVSSTTTFASTAGSSPGKMRKHARTISADVSDDGSDDTDTNAELDSSPRHSGAPSTTSSLLRTANPSSQSLVNLLNLEKARQRAQQLRPIPRTRLNKIHWHQFMDTIDADFAMAVTRIDWTMYTAIRPREFIRHVNLSTESKRRSKQPDNIHMMVKHFNHLALFVSGMILLRDKPKHRAKALEKFMSVAWKVRQMNNYNSLGAIVAGITGPEIQRLSQTWELVPRNVRKDFMKLTILMSHSRSHAAYRMAWENSSSQRIPFMPLLRQDLTRAELGNRTFVGSDGDNINWKKFEIMGEVILSIQRSQDQPYSIPQQDDEITKLILETRILEGSEDSADPRDELYKRSEQLESSGPGNDGSRKKFDWFRR